MAKKEELKILQKCYDMINYAYEPLKQVNKSERYAIVADIKNSMYALLKLIIRANKRYYKKTTLQDIDIEIEHLRYLVRLSKDLGYFPSKHYEIWSKKLDEMGKMTGGWIKSANK
jgi:four helix bundle protein